ncbi:hypothetical protein N7499_001772 [Penicillium canescens]|uniref:uncharacterized protein n=1 Tax=Penicillium canescens TaxID=5083 RepID=UPI0026DFCF60|nr:uncharacterized protein N7446_009318 [Penicillium canescens]KAJ6053306.1 hypothetical protein N7446_009318 [Penicillium canescens]KAJ6097398.1 hypothetical protein N7499_001772 [Penicillium canescens]
MSALPKANLHAQQKWTLPHTIPTPYRTTPISDRRITRHYTSQFILPTTTVTTATIRSFYNKTSCTINGSNHTATIAPKIP